MMEIVDGPTGKKPRGRKKKIPEQTEEIIILNQNQSSSSLTPTTTTTVLFSPPINSSPAVVINNNNITPSGLVFAVKSRPQPVTPDLDSNTTSVVAEKVAAAVRRTYEGKVGRHLFKFNLGQGQVGVAAVGEAVEKGMPLLCQTTDVPPTLSTMAAAATLLMPELTPVTQDIIQPSPPKTMTTSTTPGPIRPKPRFYFKEENNKEKQQIDKIEIHNIIDPIEIPGQMHRSVRNKRKKEVFDPSDLNLPRKKLSLCFSDVVIKQEKIEDGTKSSGIINSTNNNRSRKRGVGRPRQSNANNARQPWSRKEKPVVKRNERKVPDESIELCKTCKRFRNIKGQSEKFVVCSTCSSCHHPTCLSIPKEAANTIRNSNKWQCMDCKLCTICCEQLGSLSVVCSRCAEGFHLKCLKLEEKPTEWDCDSCASTDGSAGNLEDGMDEAKTPTKVAGNKRGPKPKPKRRYIRKPKNEDGRRKHVQARKEESTVEQTNLLSIPQEFEHSLLDNIEPSLLDTDVVLITSEHFPNQSNVELGLDNTAPVLDKFEPFIINPTPVLQIHEPEMAMVAPVLDKPQHILVKHELDLNQQIPAPSFEKLQKQLLKSENLPAKSEPLLDKLEPFTLMNPHHTIGPKENLEKTECHFIEQKIVPEKLEQIPVGVKSPFVLLSVSPPLPVPVPKPVQGQSITPTPASTTQTSISEVSTIPFQISPPFMAQESVATSQPVLAHTDFPMNPSTWTTHEVELYFKERGLRDEGAVFREQEIDGISLMLMRRTDIVQGMRLKLGPALKVHRLVAELQNRSIYTAND